MSTRKKNVHNGNYMFKGAEEEFNGNVHRFKRCKECGASLLKLKKPEGYYLRCSRRERDGCMYEESFDSSEIIIQKDNKMDVVYNKYKNDVKFLYHMTHKENIRSIIQYGYLFSYNEAEKRDVQYKNIANKDVQERRSKVHWDVSFYFNPKNPMLYYIYKHFNQNDIILLCFNNSLLFDKDDITFTDGNAASDTTKEFYDIRKLDQLNWDCIFDKYSWSGHNDGKRIRHAEVLVDKQVSVHYLQKIICGTSDVAEYVRQQISSDRIEVEVNRDFYF